MYAMPARLPSTEMTQASPPGPPPRSRLPGVRVNSSYSGNTGPSLDFAFTGGGLGVVRAVTLDLGVLTDRPTAALPDQSEADHSSQPRIPREKPRGKRDNDINESFGQAVPV